MSFALSDFDFDDDALPEPGVCRVCNCTDDRACMTELGPCRWVEPDLCSGCAD